PELAHVPGPGIVLQEPQRALADAGRVVPRACEATQEVGDEKRDVLPALAERRHRDLDHADAVEEVAAEPPEPDLLLEIAVRRRDEADVDLAPAVGADALHHAVLQHAQQLRLERERGLADLVEEQRASVGELELAFALGDRAGERAARVAEQLALQQLE